MTAIRSAVRSAAVHAVRSVIESPGGVTPPDTQDIPANAIYANGEAIPDPSGGYLKYGASI